MQGCFGRSPLLLGTLRVVVNVRYPHTITSATKAMTHSVQGIDPELGPLCYQWEILPEGPFFDYVPGKGSVEICPEPMPGLILKNNDPSLTFKTLAHTGPFRLLVYASGERGYGSYANLPFSIRTQPVERVRSERN
jgi:hypothetical protein